MYRGSGPRAWSSNRRSSHAARVLVSAGARAMTGRVRRSCDRRRADRTGRAVDVLKRRRDALEQRDRALRRESFGSNRATCLISESASWSRGDGWFRLPSKACRRKRVLKRQEWPRAFGTRRSQFSRRQPRNRGEPTPCRACAMLTLEMSRANRPGSTTASRLKQRGREAHDVVLDTVSARS